MLATAHDLGIKVIVDIVPNHTSTEAHSNSVWDKALGFPRSHWKRQVGRDHAQNYTANQLRLPRWQPESAVRLLGEVCHASRM